MHFSHQFWSFQWNLNFSSRNKIGFSPEILKFSRKLQVFCRKLFWNSWFPNVCNENFHYVMKKKHCANFQPVIFPIQNICFTSEFGGKNIYWKEGKWEDETKTGERAERARSDTVLWNCLLAISTMPRRRQ